MLRNIGAMRRESRVMVQLEEPIKDLLEALVDADGSTNSSYMRKLLIKHLVEKGKLETEDVLELLMA